MKALQTVELPQAGEALRDVSLGTVRELIVVTIEGQPVAVVIPVVDADMERLAVSTDPDFLDLVAESRRRLRDHEGISADEMRRVFATGE